MTNIQTNIDTVSLEFYKPEFEPLLQNYQLSEEQIKFTALPSEALLKCQEEQDRHPIVILHNNNLAGFFVLHGWAGVKDYTENEGAILLRAYSISIDFQGKGIAKHSLTLLSSFMQEYFPDKNEIILLVNLKNTIAQKLYFSCGFINTGKRVMGEVGEQYILNKKI